MAKDFSAITDQPSGFAAALKYLGRPAYAFRDLLKGNVEGAVRQGADILGDTIDAFLPGDMISEISRKDQDYTEASDLFGGMKPGIGKTAVDILGGIATDPLTFFGGSLFTAAGKGVTAGLNAARAAPVLGKVVTPLTAAAGEGWLHIKNATGNLKLADQFQPALQAGQETQQGTQAAMTAASRKALEGTLPADQESLGASLLGFTGKPGDYKVLTPSVPNTPRAIQTQALMDKSPFVSPGISEAPYSSLMPLKGNTATEAVDSVSQMLGRKPQSGPSLLSPTHNSSPFPLEVKDPRFVSGTEFANNSLISPSTKLTTEYKEAFALANREVKELEKAYEKLDKQLLKETKKQSPNSVNTFLSVVAARDALESAQSKLTSLKNNPINELDVKATAKGLKTFSPMQGVKSPLPYTAPASLADQFAAIKGTVPNAPYTPGLVNGLLGVPAVKGTTLPGMDLVKNPGEAAMFTGGMSSVPPEMIHIPAGDVERALFTQRGKMDDVLAAGERNLQELGAGHLAPVQAQLLKNSQQAWADRIAAGVHEPQLGSDLLAEGSLYGNRMFKDSAPLSDMFKGAASSSAKQRSNVTPESAVEWLNTNPTVSAELNAAKMAGQYAGQHAQLMGKAKFAQEIAKPYAASAEEKIRAAGQSVENWVTSDPSKRAKIAGLTETEEIALASRGKSLYTMEGAESKGGLHQAASKIIEDIAKTDKESALVLKNFWEGLPPREGAWKVLANVNQLFKPYATAGAFIPRMNFNIRNIMTGIPQIMSNESSRKYWPKYAGQMGHMLAGAMDDGVEAATGMRFASDKFKTINDALANSGGSFEKAIAAVPEGPMREALRHGVVTDGFANAELLSKEIAAHGWKKKFNDLRDAPASITQGAEQRMRYATFEAMVNDGVKAPEAAKIVKETFYDYAVTSKTNRAARDVIPFFQFSAKAVPQMAKAMAKHPFLIPATRPLYSASQNNILPGYLQNQISVPLGPDEKGDPSYLTSLGLPIEAMSQIPNPSDDLQTFGRQLRQNIVGGANPAIKTAYGLITGKDPYFGSNFMSYDKAPAIAQAMGADDKSELARIYNALQGTGLIQPLASPIGVLNNAVDSRRAPIERAINLLTGANIKSVDERQALKGLIEQYLQSNPSVQSSSNFFQYSKDADTQDAIKELGKIKRKLAEDRKAHAQ